MLFGLAWIAQESGTSVLLGGFAMGLVVAAIGGPKRLSAQVRGIAEGFFVPLFFVVLGARLDVSALVDHPDLLLVTGALIVLNLVVHAVAAMATRQPPPAGLIATAQLGVPAAVVQIGLQEHVITRGPGRRGDPCRPGDARPLRPRHGPAQPPGNASGECPASTARGELIIVSTTCLVLGVAAPGASGAAIVTAGIAGFAAGALSMAAGEYVSVSSRWSWRVR